MLAVSMVFADPGARQRVPAAALTAARSAIERLVAAAGAEAAVAWRPLDIAPGGSEELRLNATTSFHAASTMKVPVMIELFRQVETGSRRLDDTVALTNRFHSIVDGSPYELSAGDEEDAALYKRLGSSISLRELCEAMITVSSNLAANALIELLGAPAIQATTDRLGAPGMHVLRGVEDQKAFDAGQNNTTDAAALLTLFWKIGRSEAVSRPASAAMADVLKRQTLNDAIPAGLPAGTMVAHKTGSITRVHHDAAIVYGPRPYVLVVLTRGIEDRKLSAKLIADIAREIDKLSNVVPH